ncbi:MAG: hypothetical protein KDB00_17005, partial [Planctomycetales bacterium]|nr:hypothetical protein [Planctomycetales bacterium]
SVELSFDADALTVDQTDFDNPRLRKGISAETINRFDISESDQTNFQFELRNLKGIPNQGDVASIRVDWGDGSETVLDAGQRASLFADAVLLDHSYLDDGTYPITVELESVDSNVYPIGSSQVAIQNLPPVGIPVNDGPVNEGTPVLVRIENSLDASPIDSSSLRYSFDFNNDGDFLDLGEVRRSDLNAATIPAIYTSENLCRVVRMRVEDKDGAFTDYTTNIIIDNVAPVLSVGLDETVAPNELLRHDISFMDPGEDQPWTVLVDWNGDNDFSDPEDESIETFSRTLSLEHRFPLELEGQAIDVHIQVDDGENGLSQVESFRVQISAAHLTVETVELNASGFSLRFNQEIDWSDVNLYASSLGVTGISPADLILMRNAVEYVSGSIVPGSDSRSFEFVKTGGVLDDGDYQLMIRSADDSFKSMDGGQLDGNIDGFRGDDFIHSFAVDHSTHRIVAVGDFVRAAGQSIDLTPADLSDIALPIRINDATDVVSVDLELVYDPALLVIDSVEKATGLPADWTATVNNSTPGRVQLTASGTTALSGTDRAIYSIVARVANDAPYGASGAIALTNVLINGTEMNATGDFAFFKTSLLGDVTGDRTYSGLDASLISRVVVDMDSGFDAFPLVDPNIIAAIAGDPALSGLDASLMAQKVVGKDVPRLPEIPAGLAGVAASGIDPVVSVPDVYAIAGQQADVSLVLDNAQTGLMSFDAQIVYDATKLTLSDTNVLSGSDTASWSIEFSVDDNLGLVNVSIYSPTPLTGSELELLKLRFDVDPDATGAAEVYVNTSGLSDQNVPISRLNEGRLSLTGVGGQIRIADPGIIPEVTEIRVNDGSASRSQITSVTVGFNTLLDINALVNAFQLTNITQGLDVGGITLTTYAVEGKTFVTLTFSGDSTVTRNGIGELATSLADGSYRLVIRSSSIRSIAGSNMAADVSFGDQAVDQFFRFYGDTDGDRDVDGLDYGRFGLAFLRNLGEAGYDPGFDADGDGDVDGQDYGQFENRFLKKI